MQCNNTKFANIRAGFIVKPSEIKHNNNQELFVYIITMKDKSIRSLDVESCDILKNFDQV